MPKIILTRQRLELIREIKAKHPTIPNIKIARIVGLSCPSSVNHALNQTKREYPDEFDRFNLARILREHAHKLEHEFPTP